MTRLRLALLLALLSTTPASASLQPSDFGALAFRQHPGARLPLDALLRDEAGRTVTLGSFFHGQPVLLVLDYLRCPNLCGVVLNNLVGNLAQAGLRPGRDLQFLAISIDPAETPADAAAARADYMRRGRAPPESIGGWHFLGGAAPEVRRIADAIGFPYRYDATLRQYAHPAGYVVVTPDGRISRYMLGIAQAPPELRSAVAAAGTEQVAPPAYPLLLLCLGFDPQPGSIAYLAMQALRLVALAIVAGWGLWALAAIRRERRARR